MFFKRSTVYRRNSRPLLAAQNVVAESVQLGFKHSYDDIRTVACFVVRPQCSLEIRPFGVGRHRDEHRRFPYLTTHATASW
ncbi:BZ3500_MvSof-1268-A1-R1_Chr11-1g03236 [Microbotryum saponariae]|uniref:BZ3500_MvSof-1268-A1-R1_Chr11-1g03236 protein n=1 Tax=Microbotryum saponariae TaxID=289078 RepID=A0A2X0NEK3_9BASI|nr:BZ3501_MvSof-1269-A2-R1_Chr11g02811 [Microbotryum saponariae]SDA03796.1 BZ3500_MvSof-1268-A1-R1_Chr11-1g03236 [Microbotryum saponariae]